MFREQYEGEGGPRWECIHCHSIMDKTNFSDFIKQSDNDRNSILEARVQYHTWRLTPSSKLDQIKVMPEI
jgi:hypothetical protein